MTKPVFAAMLMLAATTAAALADDLKPNGTYAGTEREQGQTTDREAPAAVTERPVINEFGDRKAFGAYQDASDEPRESEAAPSGDSGAKARTTGGRVIGISGAELRRAIERAPRASAPAPNATGVDPAEVRRKIRDRTTTSSQRDGI